jgi:hypothetical protein
MAGSLYMLTVLIAIRVTPPGNSLLALRNMAGYPEESGLDTSKWGKSPLALS